MTVMALHTNGWGNHSVVKYVDLWKHVLETMRGVILIYMRYPPLRRPNPGGKHGARDISLSSKEGCRRSHFRLFSDNDSVVGAVARGTDWVAGPISAVRGIERFTGFLRCVSSGEKGGERLSADSGLSMNDCSPKIDFSGGNLSGSFPVVVGSAERLLLNISATEAIAVVDATAFEIFGLTSVAGAKVWASGVEREIGKTPPASLRLPSISTESGGLNVGHCKRWYPISSQVAEEVREH